MDLEEARQRVWQRLYAPAAVGVGHDVTALWYGQLSLQTQGAAARRLGWMRQEELRAQRVLRQIAPQETDGTGTLPRALPEALSLCLQAESQRIALYDAQAHQEPFGGIYEILCRQAKRHQFHLLSILGLLG